MRRIVLLYMPVIHRGYVEFLARNGSAEHECRLLDTLSLRELGEGADYVLRKDKAIRGLPDTFVRDTVRSMHLFKSVELQGLEAERGVVHLTIPEEDVSMLAAQRYYPRATVTRDPVRLRYDRTSVQRTDPVPAVSITAEDAYRQLIRHAEGAAALSNDWWLSVGALVARNGVPLFTAYNRSAADPDIQNILGDPRSQYSRGEGTDLTLVLHAERGLVAQAARAGISLLGCDAFITHFPCVPCAASLAEAGIARIFFKQGYSRLEAAEYLLAKGVELFQVI